MDEQDWERLGRYIIDRRVNIGLRTREALAAKSGLSTRLLGDVEKGRRTSYSPGTLAVIEQSLHWVSGSAKAILEGGEPGYVDAFAAVDDVGDELFFVGPGDHEQATPGARESSQRETTGSDSATAAGAEIRRVGEWKFTSQEWDGLGRAHLPDWFPKDRVGELAEALEQTRDAARTELTSAHRQLWAVGGRLAHIATDPTSAEILRVQAAEVLEDALPEVVPQLGRIVANLPYDDQVRLVAEVWRLEQAHTNLGVENDTHQQEPRTSAQSPINRSSGSGTESRTPPMNAGDKPADLTRSNQVSNVVRPQWGDRSVPPPSLDEADAADADPDAE